MKFHTVRQHRYQIHIIRDFFELNLVQAGNTSYFLIVAMKFHS
jgi:hypothetical protein